MLDEPSSGLDPDRPPRHSGAIIRTIADEGRTVLFSSHLLDEVERVADEVAMIRSGRILFCDSLDEIKQSHAPRDPANSQIRSRCRQGFRARWLGMEAGANGPRYVRVALNSSAKRGGDRRSGCPAIGGFARRNLHRPQRFERFGVGGHIIMRSAVTALAWEFWGANRRGWFVVLAVMIACALLFRVFAGSLNHSEELRFFTYFPMVMSVILAAGFCNFTDRTRRDGIAGFPRHLFSLPVSTPLAVTSAFACGVLSVVGIYVAWVTIVLRPLDVPLLVCWPSVVLAAGVVLYQAIIWCLCGFRLTRIVSLSLVASALVVIGCCTNGRFSHRCLGYRGKAFGNSCWVSGRRLFRNAGYGRHTASRRRPWLGLGSNIRRQSDSGHAATKVAAQVSKRCSVLVGMATQRAGAAGRGSRDDRPYSRARDLVHRTRRKGDTVGRNVAGNDAHAARVPDRPGIWQTRFLVARYHDVAIRRDASGIR